jgi:hypothetical protein
MAILSDDPIVESVDLGVMTGTENNVVFWMELMVPFFEGFPFGFCSSP